MPVSKETSKTKGKPRQMKAPKPKKVDPLEPLKMEIASELGFVDKVKKAGWGGLTSAESGRLGGIMNRRLKHTKQAACGEKTES